MPGRHFELLHDDGRPICIVGNTYCNHLIFDTLNRQRQTLIMTLEECQQQPTSFFQDHQFFSTSSTMPFKIQVIDWLQSQKASFVTVIDSTSVIDTDAQIGRNTMILSHNAILKSSVIGDHCHMVNHITTAHDSIVGDFGYICACSYLIYTTLGRGVVSGLRSSFVPKSPLRLCVPDWTNFMISSIVHREISTTGTYFGNRKINDQTSLTHSIL